MGQCGSAASMSDAVESTVRNYSGRVDSFAAWADGSQAASGEVARNLFLQCLQSVPLSPSDRERALYRVLDAGCGPGRDLAAFTAFPGFELNDRPRGAITKIAHEDRRLIRIAATGLEPCMGFAMQARAASPGSEVLEYDFGALPDDGIIHDVGGRFHGIFCLASLFHVPASETTAVLRKLRACLCIGGILLSSFPNHSKDHCGDDGRWQHGLPLADHKEVMKGAGFEVVQAVDNFEIYNGTWSLVISRKI